MHMCLQVQATFAGGLSEHLQAAGGANASVAASLRESLGTAAQLVTDLKTDLQEGQNSLLQLATQRSKHCLSKHFLPPLLCAASSYMHLQACCKGQLSNTVSACTLYKCWPHIAALPFCAASVVTAPEPQSC